MLPWRSTRIPRSSLNPLGSSFSLPIRNSSTKRHSGAVWALSRVAASTRPHANTATRPFMAFPSPFSIQPPRLRLPDRYTRRKYRPGRRSRGGWIEKGEGKAMNGRVAVLAWGLVLAATRLSAQTAPEWRFVEELRIGSENDDPSGFSDIRGILVDRQGNIWGLEC